jgi:recombination-promoting nuclease RpnB
MNPFHLIDLSQVPDEKLQEFLYFGTMAILAKHIWDPNVVTVFKEIMELLKKLDERGEVDYICVMASYAVAAGNVPDEREFIDTLKTLEATSEDKIMTLAEQYRQKGIREGIERGRLEGIEKGELRAIHKIALRMLDKEISLQEISDATGLPLEEAKKLRGTVH